MQFFSNCWQRHEVSTQEPEIIRKVACFGYQTFFSDKKRGVAGDIATKAWVQPRLLALMQDYSPVSAWAGVQYNSFFFLNSFPPSVYSPVPLPWESTGTHATSYKAFLTLHSILYLYVSDTEGRKWPHEASTEHATFWDTAIWMLHGYGLLTKLRKYSVILVKRSLNWWRKTSASAFARVALNTTSG